MDEFAYGIKTNGNFIIQNISNPPKTVKIFNYPTAYGKQRDLLEIPGVAEADIRASLLKGDLNNKIRAQEIAVIFSDIDLLQFNSAQKTFLQNAGITIGLDVGVSDDWLLDNDPVEPSNIYQASYNGSQISSESWFRQDNTLIKKINYTFTGSTLTQEVRQIFDTTGINIIGQLTINYIYTAGTLTSYTATRDI